MRLGGRRPDEDVYSNLRNGVLTLDPAKVGLTPKPTLQHVWGAMLETAYPEGIATLVALADGTTSLYTSSGGGMIGGGAHADVILATAQFLAAVESSLDLLGADPDAALPAPGQTAIRALTYTGRLVVVASEDDLGNQRHPASGLFYAGQAVITALREVTEPE